MEGRQDGSVNKGRTTFEFGDPRGERREGTLEGSLLNRGNDPTPLQAKTCLVEV